MTASNQFSPNHLDFAFKEGSSVFAPKDLVQLGRPGTGTANSAGDLVLIPYSQYSFEDKKNQKSIFIAPLESSASPLQIPLTKGGEAFWLDSRTVAHAVEGDDKVLQLYAISVKFETELSTPESPTLIGSFPTSGVTNFRYSPAAGRLVFSEAVYPDGDITKVKENDEAWENRGTTALVYDSTFERHWDHWVTPKSNSLFSVKLSKDSDNKWSLGSNWINLLKDTKHQSPVEPFGGTDDFAVSDTSLVYTTKDPELPPAWHTKQNVYITSLDGSGKVKELTSGKQGAIHSVTFSSKQDKVAWLELDEDGYESDRSKVVIYDLKKDVRYTLTQSWDRSPDGFAFSEDDTFLYLTAGDHARGKVFVLPVPPTPTESTTHPKLAPIYTSPVVLTKNGGASGIQTLPNGRIVFSASSHTAPNDVYIIRDLKKLEAEILQNENNTQVSFKGKAEQITKLTAESLKDKTLSPGEDFWFEGAVGKQVHGWVLKPPGFKEGDKKKWPIVLLIHGGPQGAWEDKWSTRWNPNIFANQGYFTVAINPTGSTTYGQEFVDAIAGDWGGRPFDDLLAGWKYILGKYKEVDPERAVAAGASWGGYAINWIQGHPEYGFNFKALVCHDGVFDSNYNGYTTEELYFFNHDWKGRPWDKESKILSEKFSPANYVNKWSTPQLLIHGSKDYRLPETESIGVFHALQQLGIPTRLVVFPDENHWVLNHGNSIKWHYEVFRWFDQFVGEKKH